MKSLKIYHLLVALLVGTFISCAEEDGEGDPQETGLSGLYVGTAFQGSTQVGTWVATVYENRLIGVSTGEAGEVIFEGTVTNSGAVSGSFDLADIDGIVYTTNISGQIENGTMSGVWSDDEDSGTWSGGIENSGTNGLYAGTASQGSTQVGTWVATVYNNLLIGVSTGEAGEVIFEGTVTNSGVVSGSFDLTAIDGIVYTTNISGQIENGTMSGVWSDDEDSGTWTGERL